MEVKPGYKQTEVGVIPEDWDIEPLGTRASFKTGPFGSALHQSDYVDGGIPVINPMHINDGRITPSAVMSVSEEAARRLTDFRLKPGEIIIGRRGDMGRCAVVDEGHAGWMCGTGSMLIRPRIDHPEFLQRILSSPVTIKAIEDASVGSTMINLNQASLSRLNIQVPPVEEQRAIATALSDMDALLDGLGRLIVKKRAIKQAAMQQLLTGQTRLPGFSGEWAVKRLSAVLRFQVGFPFSSVYFNESGNGIRLIKNRDLKADDQVTHYSGEYDSAFLVKDGDVLVGMDGDFLPCLWSKGKALLNQRVGRVIPSKELNSTYAYYRLQEPLKAIEVITSSTTVKHLSHDDVAGIEIPLPCIEEQTAIAKVLSDMDAEITVLEARRTKTHALKQAMMQELLTGRTRLVAPASESSGKVVNISAEKAKAKTKAHNWQINEAVVISVLASRFGSEQYPLGRKRYTKLAYLMHRYVEHVAEGFRKKAAGPYNPDVKYRGPEGIAQKNGYIRPHRNGNFSGFVAAGNIAQAEAYFMNWYGQDVLDWIEQFRKKTNDELELLTTVDMSVEDLEKKGSVINLESVKALIAEHPEWKPKLERPIFSDINIKRAIHQSRELFAEQG